MQLASVVQVLSLSPASESASFRQDVERAFKSFPTAVNHAERLIAQALLTALSLRRLGWDYRDVILAGCGLPALQLILPPQSAAPPNGRVNNQPVFEKAKRIVDHDFASRLSVVSISRQLHVPRNRLSAEFRRKYGISLPQYIANCRVLSGARMLSVGHIAVDDVATSVGYRSKKDFVHQFRAIMGLTPSAYRSVAH
jgi:AraC-like DNA-binding protein